MGIASAIASIRGDIITLRGATMCGAAWKNCLASMKLATLCYVKRAGQTLMLHRIKRANDIHAGKWNGLGGKLEPGESPEQCVIREVREESGLLIQRPRYHGLLVFSDFKDDDWYVWTFSATE